MSKQLILVLVVVVAAALLALPLIPRLLATRSPQEASSAEQIPSPGAVASATEAPASAATANTATMSKLQFDQIRTGMSYAQCVQLVGGEGTRSGDVNAAGEEKITWVLVDDAYGPGRTNIATLRFRNGALYGKGISSKQNNRSGPYTTRRSGEQ